jgi:hypothetical protein
MVCSTKRKCQVTENEHAGASNLEIPTHIGEMLSATV